LNSRKKRVLSWVLASLWLAFCVSGCAWGKKKEQATTPQAMYEDAMSLFQRKKYERAAQAFKKFKEEFPLSDLTPMVELRTADAYFFDKNYSEAIVLYEEFKKLHPLHPEIPYSIGQLGMCHFKQMHTLDRDQTETEKAIEQFRYLIENFPQSPHVPEARTKMKICQKQLADHEFYVGNFYMRMKKYKGALDRFEGILQKFPESGLDEKVKRLAEKCRAEIAKEEQKKKGEEAQEERKKKEREEKKKATGSKLPSLS
jgi:outer membrane protein assembly factor BamD